jgi:hypothetical protein
LQSNGRVADTDTREMRSTSARARGSMMSDE